MQIPPSRCLAELLSVRKDSAEASSGGSRHGVCAAASALERLQRDPHEQHEAEQQGQLG